MPLPSRSDQNQTPTQCSEQQDTTGEREQPKIRDNFETLAEAMEALCQPFDSEMSPDDPRMKRKYIG